MTDIVFFGLLFFGSLFFAGVFGAIVDKLTECKWVDRMCERMMHE